MKNSKYAALVMMLVLMLSAVLPFQIVAQTQAPAQSAAVSAVDSLGTPVSLAKPAERVVSLAPGITEVLFAMGAGKTVVGNTTYCDYPQEALSVPKVGGFSAKSMSVEKIVALKPDLVVTSGKIHKAVADELLKYGIAIFAYAPNTFAEIARDMAALGRLTGNLEQARSAGAEMLTKIAAVQTKVASIAADKRISVFWETYDEPLMTCGASTFQHAMIETAGGVDIFSDLPGAWPTISQEEVIKRMPQVIAGADDHGDKMTVEQVSRRPGWNLIPAVKNSRIFLLPSALVSRPTPRLAQGVERMAAYLYPTLFR